MRTLVICLMLLAFCVCASAATARDADNETPSPNSANEKAAKSADSAKPEVREGEKDAVKSELQDLRDIVQTQSEQLQDLRKRLAALETGGTSSKEVVTPAIVPRAGNIQPLAAAETSAVSMPPAAMVQDTSPGQNESKSPLSFKIGSADFTPGGFVDFTTFYRSTDVGSGIATSFGTVPSSNHLHEGPNFQVGLTWLRQPQFRLTYHPTSNWAIAVSLENPQQFVPGSVVFPSPFFTPQFDNGSGSTSAASSATNTAVPNLHPDIVVKTAGGSHLGGRALPSQAAGVIRSFKRFNNLPNPARNHHTYRGRRSVH